jgi:FKBP-type peptidyl-prolyl cis-trans isomerase SlyD
MTSEISPTIIADNVVVSLAYILRVEGEEIDSADSSEPLEFIQGMQTLIPGLEKELYGMKVGDKKTIKVTPEEAYGEIDPDNFMDVPRSEFPKEIPLKVGTELELRDEDEEIISAVIVEVKKDSIRLDLNHPLAGQTLVFDIEVLGLRTPTAEELEHGHVHGEDWDEEDEEFDEEFIEFFEEEDDDDAENYDGEKD